MAHKFRELLVWPQAMDLVSQIYTLTRAFPKDELFGLTSQLRRAAISVPLNIAEGAGSESLADFRRFLDIALKSSYETMTALEIAERLDYCTRDQLERLFDDVDHVAATIVLLTQRFP